MTNRAILLVSFALGAAACDRNAGIDSDAAGSADPADLALLTALEARTAELEADLQTAWDYRGILDNELQYTRGLDRHDEAMISTVFWPDARVSYGELVSMDEMAAWANTGHAENAAHQHHLTGLILDIDGATAHEEGYIFFSSDMERDTSFDTVGAPTPGRAVSGSLTTFGTGRYVNRYERRNGEWRMIVHEYVHDISLMLEPVDLCATACLGRWDRTDISYMRPLRTLSADEREQRAAAGRAPKSAPPANPIEHQQEAQ
jgi:hypothetical protein